MRIGSAHRVLSLVAVSMLTACASGLSAASAGADGCANEQLRIEQPYGFELPDCRAYEMVSPLYKDDNNIVEGKARASVSGRSIVYESSGSFAEAKSAPYSSTYIAVRESDGWSTRNLSPPYHTFQGELAAPFQQLIFTPDLSRGLEESFYKSLTSGAPDGYINLYVADVGGGSYQAVTGPPVTGTPPGFVPYEQEQGLATPNPAGASTDLEHVVFQQYTYEGTPLTPEASPNHNHIYEWSAGHLSLVDIPPEGITFGAQDSVGAPGDGGGPLNGNIWHAVSSDGSRVVFTAGDGERQESWIGQLYVRELDQHKTVEVSASQRTTLDPNGPRPARYWDASTDGSSVLFTSRAELTNDANTGVADNASNLYEYDLKTGVLSDLTVDTNAGDVNGAEVLGVVNASDDDSYVYFVANGVLAQGAVTGKPNLYLYHAGEVKFIAGLAAATSVSETLYEQGGDSTDWTGARPEYGENSYFDYGPGTHTARMTSDGTHLAFESEQALTGYDNEPSEPQDCEGKCREVYLYGATDHSLVCVSCDPNGARPIGPSMLGGHEQVREAVAGESPFYMPRNFSDDGGRLFFQSPDPLVVHDGNGRQDVYEYEGGHVYPISDVAGNSASYFLDASVSGNDVFIATSDQLLPSDTDFRVDAYDVSVDGGLPVSSSPPPCDNGDSCKAAVSAQPEVFGAPASATFSGAGNAVVTPLGKSVKVRAKPRRCGKGHVRRRGRCVRKKAGKSAGHSKRRAK